MPTVTAHRPSRCQNRHPMHDERGAMMLFGVFAAVFLCAAVFHVVGIGEAIAHRERMQDAADAAAMAGAVVHANGMNLLVLINLVMAGLLAILVAIKLTETLAIIGLMVASGFSFMPGAAATIPMLADLVVNSRNAYNRLDDPIHGGLRVLNATARAVKHSVPLLSEARVLDVVDAFGAPAQFGIAVPGNLSLPVEDGSYGLLCGKAGQVAGRLAALPLESIGVEDLLSGPLEDLTSGNADWFCDGSRKPPSTTISVDKTIPELPMRAECRLAGEAIIDGKDDDGDEARHICEQAADEERRSQPNPDSGDCEQDCGPDGAYAMRTALAREACEPARKGKPTLSGFLWQEQRVRRTYRRQRGRMVLTGQEVLEGPVLRRDDDPPCGRGGIHDGSWQDDAGDPNDDDWPRPLCDTLPAVRQRGSAARTLEGIEVLHVFGCSRSHRETRTPSGAGEGAQRHSDEAPQALLPSVHMGSDDFQVRGAVIGQAPGRHVDSAVEAASWGQPGSESSQLSARLSFAQAEYFFDGEDRADALWQMRWKARLRRFRLSGQRGDRTAGDLSEACGTLGKRVAPSLCAALGSELDLVDSLVVH